MFYIGQRMKRFPITGLFFQHFLILLLSITPLGLLKANVSKALPLCQFPDNPPPNRSEIIFPYDGLVTEDTSFLATWTRAEGDPSYVLQVSFINTFPPSYTYQQIVNDTAFSLNITPNQQYYIRLKYSDLNGDTITSETSGFHLFRPTSLSSLRCWYAADHLSYTGGSPIPSWNDLGPYQFQMQQGVAAQQPVFLENRIEGRPTVRFDGVNDILVSSSSSNTISFDLFSVTGLGLAPGPFYNGNTGANGYGFYRSDTAYYGMLFGGAAQVKFGKVTSRDYQIWECSRQPGQAEMFVNGLKSGSTSGASANTPAGNAYLGGVSSSNFFKGEVAEVLLFNQKLSLDDKTLVYKYLHDKYAPPPVRFAKNTLYLEGFCPQEIHVTPVYRSYHWSTGDTTASTTVTEAGWVSVTVTDRFGHQSSDSLYVHYPAYTLGDRFACLGDTLVMQAVQGPSFSYIWTNGAQDTVSLADHAEISEAGQYVLMIRDAALCQVSDTIYVSFDLLPQYDLVPSDTLLCKGEWISIQPPPGTLVSCLWSDGTQDYQLQANTENTYSVTITDDHLCQVTDSVHVMISGEAPVIDFQVSHRCSGDTALFQAVLLSDDSITGWEWLLGDGYGAPGESIQHVYLQDGNPNVTLTATSMAGCHSKMNKEIQIFRTPGLSLVPDSVCLGISYPFTANAQMDPADTIVQWLWDFGDGFQSGDASPFHSYSIAGSMPVSVEVVSAEGCRSTASDTLLVVSSSFLPGTFINIYPFNNQYITDTVIPFFWTRSSSATRYVFQLSTHPSFSTANLLHNLVLTDTSFTLHTPVSQDLYWRVKAVNLCQDTTIGEANRILSFDAGLPGLTAWYRADGLDLPGGARVPQWNDEGPESHHALNPVEDQQPFFIPDAINGRPALEFDGLNDYLATPLISDTTSFDMIVVSTLGKKPGPFYNGKTGNNGFGFLRNDTSFYGALYGGVANLAFGMIKHRDFQILELQRGLGISRFRVNNQVSGNAFTATPVIPSGSTFLGACSSSESFKGKIAEVLFFDRNLDDAARTQVFNYLHDKYGPPPVELGAERVSHYSLCPAILSVDPVYASYHWSNGDTTFSTTYHQEGWIYITVTDPFDVVSSDSVYLHYPICDLKDTTLCLGDTVSLNSWIGDHYSYSWHASGMGQLSASSSVMVSDAGQYWTSITDSLGCTLTDTIKIAVDSFAYYTHFGGQILSLCQGDHLHLEATGPDVASYLWNTGSDSSAVLLQSPGHYSVTVTNQRGCEDQENVDVSFHGLVPVADFSFSDSVCKGSSTFFQDLSHPAVQDTNATLSGWSWNFGDSSFSFLQQPSHLFVFPGLHPVTLTVTTDSGCSASVSRSVFVTPLPVAYFNTAHGCSGDPVAFSDQTYHPIGQGSGWSWDFGDPTSGSQNHASGPQASHTYDTAGIYPVRLIVITNLGCIDTLVRLIEIIQSPLPDFTYSQACDGQAVQFTDLTTVFPWSTILGWEWDFGDSTPVSSLQHPQHTFSQADTFQVSLQIQTLQCLISRVLPVVIDPLPQAAFNASDLCQNTDYGFQDLSTVITGSVTQWYWNLGPAGISLISNPTANYADTGMVILSLCVTSDKGCNSDTLSYPVMVYPLPKADFDYQSQASGPGYLVSFQNLSSPPSLYFLWDFGDGSGSTDPDPVHLYSQPGTYPVSLVGFTPQGCSDSLFDTLRLVFPSYDVALAEVSHQYSASLLKVSTEVVNLGNTPVYNLSFELSIRDLPLLTETWTGDLSPGGSLIYSFSANAHTSSVPLPYYYCVRVYLHDSLLEVNPQDNIVCRELVEGFYFPGPYPNPAGENLSVPFILSRDQEYRIELVDMLGQQVYKALPLQGKKGLNQVDLPLGELPSGCYTLRLIIEGVSHEKRIIRD